MSRSYLHYSSSQGLLNPLHNRAGILHDSPKQEYEIDQISSRQKSKPEESCSDTPASEFEFHRKDSIKSKMRSRSVEESSLEISSGWGSNLTSSEGSAMGSTTTLTGSDTEDANVSQHVGK